MGRIEVVFRDLGERVTAELCGGWWVGQGRTRISALKNALDLYALETGEYYELKEVVHEKDGDYIQLALFGD